jgi:hypothetical protein
MSKDRRGSCCFKLRLFCFVIPEGLIGDPYSLLLFWIPAFAGMTQKQEIALIPTFTGGEFPLELNF